MKNEFSHANLCLRPNIAGVTRMEIIMWGKNRIKDTRGYKRKYYNRWIGMLLTVVVLVCHTGVYSVNASYSNLTSDSIKEKEEQIEAAEKEKNELQSSVTDLQLVLNDLESVKSDLATYVTRLDATLSEINDKVAELQLKIEAKQKEIVITKQELQEAVITEEKQYTEMKQRIQFIYEQGNQAVAEILFSATSFGDILNKADYVEMLSSYDRKILNGYIETRELVEQIKLVLDSEEILLEETNIALESEQEALETLIEEKEQEILYYQFDITNKESIKAQLQANLDQETAVIKALELAVAEEKRQLAEENGILPTYDGGTFAWPCPEYTRISSDYGMRIHPVYGVEMFHSGVDMAAPAGSPILAAYDGKVTSAGYSSSMGNYVLIDHGDELYTIYMHACALYVSTGQIVIRGEKIAGVGTTGTSTGNHLHFGVRENGVYVNPWTYLK
ncbi:MAG: peptidoglycan DD-metalloendopeptidase family protein [Eubacteriales bacterium]